MKIHGMWIVVILVFAGIILGTLGTLVGTLGAWDKRFLACLRGPTGWRHLVRRMGCAGSCTLSDTYQRTSNVGWSGILGFIPANLAQGLIPAWAFRHFHFDPAISGRKELDFYAIWGALVPAVAGGLIGSVAVILFGEASWSEYPLLVVKWATPNVAVSLLIGIPISPDVDAFWETLTGHQFLVGLLRFHGWDEGACRQRAEAALEQVALLDASDRRVGGYSKGMRQRLRVRQALAHEPEVLLLDEPLTGMDPVNRRRIIDLVRRLGREGRTVLVSSHILTRSRP